MWSMGDVQGEEASLCDTVIVVVWHCVCHNPLNFTAQRMTPDSMQIQELIYEIKGPQDRMQPVTKESVWMTQLYLEEMGKKMLT